MVAISSWGRLTDDEHDFRVLDGQRPLAAQLVGDGRKGLAYGMGRSYGDECLNPGGVLWGTRGLQRFIQFDPATGRLRCQSGVLLRDIQRLFVPRGWMLPVSPGTQMVTVGGAVANDVHGKNHHVVGSFGNHVSRVSLFRTDGTTITCGPDIAPDWFAATIGGMGLTGVIADVELQLQAVPGPWIATETSPFESLPEFFSRADSSEADWSYTVAWIDCTARRIGRGVFMRGNSVAIDDRAAEPTRSITMPFTPPVSVVNRMTLKPFNFLYYQAQKKRGASISNYQSFFYPLDGIQNWNRMYGPRGFYQYQSVVPRSRGPEAIAEMLDAIKRSGEGSFLAVLKTFGDRDAAGMMSFPRRGVTLALDFPNNGVRTNRLLERLDDIVREAKGRVYAAKDARMPRDLFESGYPRLPEFLSYRDPGISSALSRRLLGS